MAAITTDHYDLALVRWLALTGTPGLGEGGTTRGIPIGRLAARTNSRYTHRADRAPVGGLTAAEL